MVEIVDQVKQRDGVDKLFEIEKFSLPIEKLISMEFLILLTAHPQSW